MTTSWSDTLAAYAAGQDPQHQGHDESDEAFAARLAALADANTAPAPAPAPTPEPTPENAVTDGHAPVAIPAELLAQAEADAAQLQAALTAAKAEGQ